MPLNTQYFEKIYSDTCGEVLYESYRPRDKPMILFSLVDGSPLAALTLRCQVTSTQIDLNGTRGRALISSCTDNFMPDLQRFQGLIDRDGQEFELVISNLSSKGHINFNILKSDEKVSSVNPFGLNEINELRGDESYAVKCSQENNLSLILSSIKDETTGNTITIKEDENAAKKTGDKTKGTYYFLSIVPEKSNTELCNKFAKTTWKCVDLFVKQTPISSIQHNSLSGLGQNEFLYEFGALGAPRHFGRVGRTRSNSMLENSTTRVNNSYTKSKKCSKVRSDSIAGDILPNSMMETFSLDNATVNTNFSSSMLDNAPKLTSTSLDVMEGGASESNYKKESNDSLILDDCCEIDTLELDNSDNNLSYYNEDHEDNEDYESNIDTANEKKIKKTSNTFALQKLSMHQDNDIIMNSQAASIKYGQKLEVNSIETGIEYDFDKSCSRCVIGLSISDKLTFFPEADIQSLVEDSKELIKEYQESKYVSTLEKVFDLGDCCICLDENPDTVFYQCGHKCIHIACIDKDLHKCPVCRIRISAYLKLTDGRHDTTDINDDISGISSVVDDIVNDSDTSDFDSLESDTESNNDVNEIADAIKDKVVFMNT